MRVGIWLDMTVPGFEDCSTLLRLVECLKEGTSAVIIITLGLGDGFLTVGLEESLKGGFLAVGTDRIGLYLGHDGDIVFWDGR